MPITITVVVGSSKPVKAAAPEEWKPPPLFEVVKELNAHAGRLLTSLALLLTATAFSLSNGQIRDVLPATDRVPQRTSTIILLLLLATNLIAGFMSINAALQPPVPIDVTSEAGWAQLVISKRGDSIAATWCALIGAGCLATAWFLVDLDPPSLPILHIGLPIALAWATVNVHVQWRPKWPWLGLRHPGLTR